jgi:hypothetical protein
MLSFGRLCGIRYCAIFVKLTESLTDRLVVQYTNGTKRSVAGMFLFTDQALALAWLEDQKQKELSALNIKITEINAQIEDVYKRYLNVPMESAPKVAVVG